MRATALFLALFALTTAPVQAADHDGFSQDEIDAANANPREFIIDPATIKVKNLGTAPSAVLDPSKAPEVAPTAILDDIINIGQRLFKLIEKNKPVVDIKTTSANAFPKGIAHWTQLSAWSLPQATLYEYTAKNFWGKTVVKIRYQVHRMHGGSFEGQGRYLNHVTIEPLEVFAAYGYKIYLTAEIPSVANVGTAAAPVAGMIATIKWTINTTLDTKEGTTVYYLQGDGAYRDVGGPFDDHLMAAGSRVQRALTASSGALHW